LRRLKPNLDENLNITFDYLKAQILFYGKKNIVDSVSILMSIIQRNKYYMKANFLLWDIFKSIQDYYLLAKFSYYLIKISHSEFVLFSDWLVSYKLYAKALFFNNMYEDAIHILMNTLDIFVTLPMDDIRYLNIISKNNNISMTNEFMNNTAIGFFSKRRIFLKSIKHFQKPIKKSNQTYNPDAKYYFCHSSVKSFYHNESNIIDDESETICETLMNCEIENLSDQMNSQKKILLNFIDSGEQGQSPINLSLGTNVGKVEDSLNKDTDESFEEVTINNRVKIINYLNKSIPKLSLGKDNYPCKLIKI